MAGVQSIKPGRQKPFLPTNNGRVGGVQPFADGRKRDALGQQQNQLGAENIPGRQGSRLGDAHQFILLLLTQPQVVTIRTNIRRIVSSNGYSTTGH